MMMMFLRWDLDASTLAERSDFVSVESARQPVQEGAFVFVSVESVRQLDQDGTFLFVSVESVRKLAQEGAFHFVSVESVRQQVLLTLQWGNLLADYIFEAASLIALSPFVLATTSHVVSSKIGRGGDLFVREGSKILKSHKVESPSSHGRLRGEIGVLLHRVLVSLGNEDKRADQ